MVKSKFCAALGAMAAACITLTGCVALSPPKGSEIHASSTYPVTSTTKTNAWSTNHTISDDPSLKAFKAGMGNHVVGIAFLGNVDSEATTEQLRTLVHSSEYAQLYSFLCDTDVVAYEGTELYAFVPQGDGSITVYSDDISESGEYKDLRKVIVYEGRAGEALLLRCNTSELHANVVITVRNNGQVFSFHPVLSMVDNHIALESGCYEFTRYDDAQQKVSVRIATELLMQTDEVQYYLEQGMSLLYTKECQKIDGRDCMIFALGTNKDDQFVREVLYAVSDNLIYAYDAASDSWQPLGFG